MNNVYRRQPLQHKLPKGWNDIDAVKYNSISSIQGLHHADNVAAVIQNSTYNCKNVYQDESGNLTVRPSVRHRRTIDSQVRILGLYKTARGDLLHVLDGNSYFLKSTTGDTPVEIGAGNITIQESNDTVYIMYTDIDGKLQFKNWNGKTLVDFEPDILVNDPKNLILSRHNLLTDKYIANIKTHDFGGVIDKPWEDYIIEYDSILQVQGKIIYKIFLNGTQYFITEDGILYIFGENYNKIDLKQYLDINSYTDALDYCIWEDDKGVYLSYVISGALTCFLIDGITGSLNEQYKITDYIDDYWIVRPLSSHKAFAAKGYEDVVVDLIDKTVEFKLPIYKSNLSSGGPSWGGHFPRLWTNEEVIFFDMESLVDKNEFYNVSNFTRYNYITKTKSYITNIGIPTNGAINNNLQAIRTPYAVGYYVNELYGEPAKVVMLFNSAGVRSKSFDSMPQFYASSESLTICYNKEFYDYNKSSGDYTELDIEGYTAGGVYDSGKTLVLMSEDNKFHLLHRYLESERFVLFRQPSENIPLLSQITDEVLTSFYLDNIYWFVTKHRIFGTGVANEQFSIKYFDPRKYFYFNETLTGAIRISDSSFWVLHSNGAYLIYKSASEVYDETINQYVETITWLSTNTAESKGCDFENAVMTLPVTSHVASVTSDDISWIQMRENVQTDDRILAPMTLNLSKFVSSLLNQTESILTSTYKYNAIFFLNPVSKIGKVPALVYNAVTQSWWYWELPFDEITQVTTTETNIEILACVNNTYSIYDFYNEYYDFCIGGLTYHIYADRILDNEPVQIEWYWESALQHFNALNYRKQLLQTNFTFGEREEHTVSFDYNFEIYADEYAEATWSEINEVIERAKTVSCKNIIADFAYIQLYMRNKQAQEYDFDAYTKPKFNAISFKYRILPGGI